MYQIKNNENNLFLEIEKEQIMVVEDNSEKVYSVKGVEKYVGGAGYLFDFVEVKGRKFVLVGTNPLKVSLRDFETIAQKLKLVPQEPAVKKEVLSYNGFFSREFREEYAPVFLDVELPLPESAVVYKDAPVKKLEQRYEIPVSGWYLVSQEEYEKMWM